MKRRRGFKKMPSVQRGSRIQHYCRYGMSQSKGKTLRQKRICISYRRSHKRDRHSSFGQTANNKEDAWGSATIVAELTEGVLFGEAFVLGGVGRIPLSVLAPEKSDVLFIDKDRTVTPCPSACGFHFDISANLIRILAEKNIFLTGRVEHLSKRSMNKRKRCCSDSIVFPY